MHVALCRVPPVGFIVQVVDGYAAIRRRAERLLPENATQLPAHAGPLAMLVTVGSLPVMLHPVEFVQPLDPLGVHAIATALGGVRGLLIGIRRRGEAAGRAVLRHPALYGHRAQGDWPRWSYCS